MNEAIKQNSECYFWVPCDGKCFKCDDVICENNPLSPDYCSYDVGDIADLVDFPFDDDGLPF